MQPRHPPGLPRSVTAAADVPDMPRAAQLPCSVGGSSLLSCGPPSRWSVTSEELGASLGPDNASPRQDWSPAGSLRLNSGLCPEPQRPAMGTWPWPWAQGVLALTFRWGGQSIHWE